MQISLNRTADIVPLKCLYGFCSFEKFLTYRELSQYFFSCSGPDFPVKMRFKGPVGATPFKIGREIKSKRALGLPGRDVISGKKNFYNSLNKRRFLFWKDV